MHVSLHIHYKYKRSVAKLAPWYVSLMVNLHFLLTLGTLQLQIVRLTSTCLELVTMFPL